MLMLISCIQENLQWVRMLKSLKNNSQIILVPKFCVMVNSGSSANLLIVAALTLLKKYNLKRGDEVLVPALGWSWVILLQSIWY